MHEQRTVGHDDLRTVEVAERARDANPDRETHGPIFQEWLKADPFWMLVACCLVNCTAWRTARPTFDLLRETYPEPGDLSTLVTYDELEEILQPLGMSRKRAEYLQELSRVWAKRPPRTAKEVKDIHGFGRYAHDSWAIFIDGVTDIEVTDKDLRWYLETRHPRASS